MVEYQKVFGHADFFLPPVTRRGANHQGERDERFQFNHGAADRLLDSSLRSEAAYYKSEGSKPGRTGGGSDF